MTDDAVRTLTFGAVGWNDPRLVEGLYPQDVPPEWYLSCYASHFDTVLVPESDWRNLPPGAEQAWLAALPSQFWFYLRVETALDEPAMAHLSALGRALGERLGGVLADAPAAGQAAALRARMDGAAVFAIGGENGSGRVWTGTDSPCPCAPVGLVSFDAPPAPRALRGALEGFLSCQDEPWSVLFMRAPAASFDDARVIGRLLGVA